MITVINHYAFRLTAADFTNAANALAERVEREGHRGILAYHFHAGTQSGHALIRYRDAAAWFGHHEIAMPWAEMAALHRAARLDSITFTGEVPPEILDWLRNSPLTAEIRLHPTPAGSFTRQFFA